MKTPPLIDVAQTKGTMITKKQLEQYDLTHKHGGNGWVMVEDIDPEYCRVAGYSKADIGKQAFLAAKSQLEITKRQLVEKGPLVDIVLPDSLMGPLEILRGEIASGKLIIKSTRYVPA